MKNVFRRNTSRQEVTTRKADLLMSLLFALFAFLYLYFMQGDYLAVILTTITDGVLGYAPFSCALIITLLLVLVCTVTARLLRPLPDGASALVVFPSALLLILLTAVPYRTSTWVGIGAATLAWGICLAVAKHKVPRCTPPSWIQIYSKNLLGLCAICVCTGLIGNTNDARHFELRVARLLVEEQTERALTIGEKSLATSPRLTALRALALDREGKLADRLFRYPQVYGCRGLLLLPADASALGFPVHEFYCRLSAHDYLGGDARKYFDGPVRQAALQGNLSARNYRLCALLLEKDLDRFAHELRLYYPATDSLSAALPTAYSEALTLYRQTRTKPLYLYEDPVVTTNYKDFEALRQQAGTQTERRNLTYKDYGHTYWWYYFYGEITSPADNE